MTQRTLFGNLPSTKCAICGKKLTVPESVRRGIGPVCFGKHCSSEDDMSPKEGEHSDYQIWGKDLKDGLVLRRDDVGCHTNVPHLVTHHSPDGFEWGYGGSGPADLALNIVEYILREEEKHGRYSGEKMVGEMWDGSTIFRLTYLIHQDFKWKYIAPVSSNAFISYEAMRNYVLARISHEEYYERHPEVDTPSQARAESAMDSVR